MATTTSPSTSLNPFRSPAVTPNPTGSSSSPTQLDRNLHASHSAAHEPADESGLNEELPPAYTPAPDVQHGETTVQYGPQRPFQAAPAPIPVSERTSQQFHPPPQRPPQPAIHVQSPPRSPGPTSLLRQLAETVSNVLEEASRPAPSSHSASRSSWSGYPGLQRQHTGRSTSSSASYNPSFRRTPPPPLPARPASTSTSPTSEFARDFYAAGTGEGQGGEASAGSASSAGTQASTSNAPTASPTPGRPLLRDGKLLVYPKGFMCHKCPFSSYSSYPAHESYGINQRRRQ
ncbi:hypothetical protein H0H87_009691 [Tephrocybe sp. NHM501043]|nr:hypothetical protein H0H87_009691 [Tephrocybe sp. NHM501043]